MAYLLAAKTSRAKHTREQDGSPIKRFLRYSIASCGVALLMMTKGHVFTSQAARPQPGAERSRSQMQGQERVT